MTRARRAPATLTDRQRELELLQAGMHAAIEGHGHLYLLSGVAGVGKTRLLEETAALATQRNVPVLWARGAAGDDAVAFAPWVHILRPLIERPAAVDRYMLNQIGRIVADAPGRAGATANEPGPERFALIDAIASFLHVVAETQPLVLLFDDLHLVSRSSLLVLELLAQELARTPILVVATYREGGLAANSPSGARLGDLARYGTSNTVRGLDVTGTRALAAGIFGRDPSARLAASLYDATGGNPLLVEAVARHLAAAECDERTLIAGSIGVPESARAAVRQWLTTLTSDGRRALETASVVDGAFDVGLIAAAARMSEADTEAALTLATTAGLLRATAPATFRFRHGLVRDVLADDLPEDRRRVVHDAVGTVLEERYAGRLESVLPALAHHFFEGSCEANAVRARAYLQRAGRQALDRRNYAGAADYFERALTLLDPRDATSAGERGALQLWLARARVRAGDMDRARRAVDEAVVLARRLGCPTLLAQAALTLRRTDRADADAEWLALLEESGAMLTAADDVVRVRVEATMARQLALRGERERSNALSRSAVAHARALDEPTLAMTLASRSKILRVPGQEEERLALSAELLERARRIGDGELLMEAYQCRMADTLAFADPAFHAAIRAAHRVSDGLRQPYYEWQARLWRGMRATLVGDFGRAKRHAAAAFRVGNLVRPHSARMALTVQSIIRLWQEGASTRLCALLDGFVAEHGEAYPECAAGRIWALAHGERRGDAARMLAALVAGDFRAVPVTPSWDVVMALLAESASLVGAAAHAPALYERLRPFAGRMVVVGPALECLGPSDRYLGLLAALSRDWSAAETHFAKSLDISRRLAALPFIARTLRDHAVMLCARGRRDDVARADTMLAEALAGALRFGMAQVVHDVTEARMALDASRGRLDVVPDADAHALDCDGDHWVFRYRGAVCRIRDRAGVRYLASLLERPHQGIAARQLTNEVAALPRRRDAGTNRMPSGSGHRSAASERVRVRVTRALRDIIRKISAADARLGAHLARSVRTGTFCCYAPPDGSTWLVVRDRPHR